MQTITTTQAEILTEEFSRVRAQWRKALKEGDFSAFNSYCNQAFAFAYVFGVLGLKSPLDADDFATLNESEAVK